MPTRLDLVDGLRASIAARRILPRREGVQVGTIIYGHDRRLMHCILLHISDGRAWLVPTDMHNCPDKFSLEVGDQPARDCEVVWREKTYIGVKFEGSQT